jgi:succinate dehydrogenase hydrophobic anchor subunit
MCCLTLLFNVQVKMHMNNGLSQVLDWITKESTLFLDDEDN